MVGCERSYVSLLCGGHRRPSLEMAARIEGLTGIRARDWVTGSTEPPPDGDPSTSSSEAAA